MQKLLAHQFARFPFGFAAIRNCSTEIRPTERENVQPPKYDKLFRKIEMEWQGHDPAVLKSYVTFVQNVCNLLEIDKSPASWQPYQRTLYCALRSKFAKKKYKLHYETRTHIRSMRVEYLTGSTASTFLEYIQRNIPEGVGMKVTYTEMCPVPELIANATEDGSKDERRRE